MKRISLAETKAIKSQVKKNKKLEKKKKEKGTESTVKKYK